ncbi:hypothetical protein WG902_11025 [Ramlibacter sp. PS3R-8]|uniref:hypothetical protein n=1 Tax=Ramlibacter sp. PS3R-8 TaxID=3133437 RepID=UPI0030AE3817
MTPAGKDDRRRGDGEAAGEPPPPLAEWFVAAIGLVVLLTSVGYLLYDGNGQSQPPAPAIRMLDIQPQQGRFLVRVQAVNESRTTAAAVRVEGTLKRGNELVERSELEFDFLPGRSTREGGMFFTADPRGLQLELAARSYRAP